MSTQDPYEQHRAAFGAELRRVAPKVRTRRRWFALGGMTVALAGAATAAIVISPTTGSRLDVLAEAKAAIDNSANSIIHYAISYESGVPVAPKYRAQSKGCQSGPMEFWRATNEGPPRYRLRIPLNRCSVNENQGRFITGAFDIAYADRTSKFYSENDGLLFVTTGLPAVADTQLPFFTPGDTRLTEGDPKDPVARIRSLLAEGKLNDAGGMQGDGGRQLRRLVGHYTELRGDPKAPKPWPVNVDYRVDAKTFAPVTIKTTQRMSIPDDLNVEPGPSHHEMITATTQFSIYETLPLNPQNERALTVDPKPGTEVATETWTKEAQPLKKPSAAERARAKKIANAQIKAGIRLRSGL